MSSTDCKSDVGITVGLIDSILTSFTLLRERLADSNNITVATEEALKDLGHDKDVQEVMDHADDLVSGRVPSGRLV